MRTIIILIAMSLIYLSKYELHAQVPQVIKYQAVARNEDGCVLTSKNIYVKTSIIQGNALSSGIYTETHFVTTNWDGLFTIPIGTGYDAKGIFTEINWSVGEYYLKLEIDKSSTGEFVSVGTSKLLAVPYALYANEAGYSKKSTSGNLVMKSPDGTLWEIKADDRGNLYTYEKESFDKDILTISYGTSFGMCLGYCKRELLLGKDLNTYILSSWQTEEYPKKECTMDVSDNSWELISGSFSVDNFMKLQDVYGCPDCADGGAEWIEIRLSGVAKKVMFEFGDNIEEISTLISLLRDQAKKFKNCEN